MRLYLGRERRGECYEEISSTGEKLPCRFQTPTYKASDALGWGLVPAEPRPCLGAQPCRNRAGVRRGPWGWTLLYFFMRRALYDDNLAACPTVARCLSDMRRETPVAALWAAWMKGGTELPPHRSPENTVVRTHITLDAGDDTALQVADAVSPFTPGGAITFQPCVEHSAWNRDAAGRGRLVLSVDLWHPELTRHEIAALQYLERHTAQTPGVLAMQGSDAAP